MNVVIDEAEEVFMKEGKGRRSIGESRTFDAIAILSEKASRSDLA